MTKPENGSSGRSGLCLALTVALLAAVADQASKWVILEHVMNPPRLIEVTPFFNLTLGFNCGVSFGMLSSDEALGRWMLIGLMLVIVAGLIIWASKKQETSMYLAKTLAVAMAATFLFVGSAVAQQDPAVPASATAPRVLGSPDAPVEVIEYASLTCHHCASFHNEVLPQVKKEFIDTGKVRLVYRDFPLDRVGLEAATMARCLPPERYFPVLSLLFAKQDDWSHAKDPIEPLARIGALAGLSRQAYDACRADKALQDSIVQSRYEGEQKHGVDSTPSFVIDGNTLKGVLRFEEFKKTVEPLLPASSR